MRHFLLTIGVLGEEDSRQFAASPDRLREVLDDAA